MKLNQICFFFVAAVITLACASTYKNSLFTWGSFNRTSGYEFVSHIKHLPALQNISIIDTKADGTEFKVNGQWIFMDTAKIDRPNYYSYVKRANELNIDKDSLFRALQSFYAIGVNEFRQRDRCYLFPVVTGMFQPERGYFYNIDLPSACEDTIQIRHRSVDFKIKLLKQISPKWFEYQEVN